MLRGLFVAALVLSGCGDGDQAPDALVGDGGDAGIDLLREYDSPDDFDRVGCEAKSLTGFEPAGIWHFDLKYPGFGSYPGLVRIQGAGASRTAWVNLGVASGRVADTLAVTSDDVFVRVAFKTEDGRDRVRAVDGCRLEPDGRLVGKFAACNSEWTGCAAGTFSAFRVGRIPGEQVAHGLALVGEWNGSSWGQGLAVNVRVVDEIAYLVRYEDGLRLVDVADPTAPKDLGWSPTDAKEIFNDVKITSAGGRTYALVASNRRGVVTIDVTDSTAPMEKGSFPPVPEGEDHINVHTLFLEELGGRTRAYIANLATSGLDVWDVTDPLAPQLVSTYVHPDVRSSSAYVHDLFVEQGRAYLSYWSLGLVVVDTQADPVLMGQFGAYDRRTNHSAWVTSVAGRRIAVTGDEDFGAHVRLVDVDTFELVGELQLRPEVSVHNIMAFANKAYVSWYQDGIRVLDLSDPAAPTVVAYYNSWEGPGSSFYEGAIGLDVDPTKRRIYVADSERGLLILDEP